MEKTKTIDLNDFVRLMLATLAMNSQRIDLKDKNRKSACLPVNYKQIIENILCADNGWKEEFSALIDIDDYFDNHFGWELRLASTIKQFLVDYKKNIEYDFEYDRLLINFTKDEVVQIMSEYSDEKIKEIMEHFTNLLVNYIYTREFQEKFYDYSALAVKKMHDMRVAEENADVNMHSPNNRSSFAKKLIFRRK